MQVVYKDHMGDDNRVVDAARVSFAKIASNYTSDQNKSLITFLARNDHWSPFGHPQITLVEKVPIFVARQRFKHTVGFVYNEVSRRYVDDAPEFFIPDVWRKRAENKKQGSSDEKLLKGVDYAFSEELFPDDIEIKRTDGYDYYTYFYGIDEHHNLCLNYYNILLNKGVAPEQARMVLPQSMYTEYYCTGSLAAWARAYKLRIDPHAQKEIQELAKEWDKIIRPLFPVSWAALVDTKENND